jgi:hypothetical protein
MVKGLASILLTVLAAAAGLGQSAQISPAELRRVPQAGTELVRYWQQLVITLDHDDAASDSTLSVVLPPRVTVADTDGDGMVADEVRATYAPVAGEVPDFFPSALSLPRLIVVGSREPAASGGKVYLQFPVTIAVTPVIPTVSYERIGFADARENDIIPGPQLTLVSQEEFEVLGSMNAVALAPVLAAGADTVGSALGTFFPEEVQVLVEVLPDLVFDGGPGLASNLVGFGDGDDGNDVEYRFFWSTSPFLEEVDQSVAQEALNADGEPYVEREGTGRPLRLLTRDLAPGIYHLYATTALTGPIPLARSRAVEVRHEPVFQKVGPATSITLDSGELFDVEGQPTGRGEHLLEIAYELVDHDHSPAVHLFYSENGELGQVQMGEEGAIALEGAVPITGPEGLAGPMGSFVWDVLEPELVASGDYFVYAAASDGTTTALKRSAGQVRVRHSPFLRLDALDDRVLSGADTIVTGGVWPQRFITFTWGRNGFDGDRDIDDDARIELYYSTLPAAEQEGDLGLVLPGEANRVLTLLGTEAELIFGNIAEDPDQREDNQHAWDLWELAQTGKAVPEEGKVYYVYGIISDGVGRRLVQMNGGKLNDAASRLVFKHPPTLRPLQPVAPIVVGPGRSGRVAWEDMDLDDDARIRVLLSGQDHGEVASYAQVAAGTTYVVNSADGRAQIEVDPSRDLSEDSPVDHLEVRVEHLQRSLAGDVPPAEGEYFLYLAIADGARFEAATLAWRAPGTVQVQSAAAEEGAARPILLLPEVFSMGTGGARQTFEVRVDPRGERVDLVQATFLVDGAAFAAVDQDLEREGVQPFVVGPGFDSAKLVSNQATGDPGEPLRLILEYFEPTALEIAGLSPDKVLAIFELFSLDQEGPTTIALEVETENGPVSRLERDGRAVAALETGPLSAGELVPGRATVRGTLALEGRQDNTAQVQVRLRQPGKYRSVEDEVFSLANDQDPAQEGVQVEVGGDGSFELVAVPAGRLELYFHLDGYLNGRVEGLTFFPAQVLEGVQPATPGTEEEPRLLGGDVAGYLETDGQSRPDNEVTLADWDYVAAFFGKPVSAQDGGQRADITGDGAVNIQDLSLVGANFQQRGPRPVYKAVARTEKPRRLELMASGRSWNAGETAPFKVQGENLEGIRAYELELIFASTQWEVLEVAANQDRGPMLMAQAAGQKGWRVGASLIGRRGDLGGRGELLSWKMRALRPDPEPPRLGPVLLVDQEDRAVAAQGLETAQALPRDVHLEQNFPNPFNAQTTIAFQVSARERVRLEVFDVLGQRVALLWDGVLAPGWHRMEWDGRDHQSRPAGSGVYLYRLESGSRSQIRRMVLLR